MAYVSRTVGDVEIVGNLQLTGTLTPGLARTNLAQDNLVVYPVPFEHLRVHDALQTTIPGTSASDDLGLYGGTFGTSQPLVRTYDLKTAGASSLYARALVRLPAEYQAAETVKFRISCGMVTTVADTSCTIDVEAYRVGKTNTLGSDLCATAATSMNSLTFSDKDFTITSASLSPGDLLDVRFRITCTDAAGATAVIGAIGGIDLLCDVKG